MITTQLQPDTIIEGPFWPEPVRVLRARQHGSAIQIEAVGVVESKYYDQTIPLIGKMAARSQMRYESSRTAGKTKSKASCRPHGCIVCESTRMVWEVNNMDTMERYKIRASIKDVIAILDSSPIHRDLIPETNLVQITNRMPIAHLGIERGLKALIANVGGSAEPTHGLHKLYRALQDCDEESTTFLNLAFGDAVSFFGYNVNAKGFTQFRSLDDYLSKVGTEKAFEELRYWAIGEAGKGESPIPYISPSIHRELLCALWCLFLPQRRETVSARIEREVAYAMFDGRHIFYNTNDTLKMESVQGYMKWSCVEHQTRCSALEEAVRQNFSIKGDEFFSQTLSDAYADLKKSKDPSVRYYIGTLAYLPKGSQLRHPDAVPGVEWFGKDQTRGMVVTPGGTYLGFVEKRPDGGWEITPEEDGLVQATEIAKALADAKDYLVNRLTRQVTAAINGELRRLRLVTDKDIFPAPLWISETEMSEDLGTGPTTYELEFWDADHSFVTGEDMSLELPSDDDPRFASVLEGRVVEVAGHKVSIEGRDTLASIDPPE